MRLSFLFVLLVTRLLGTTEILFIGNSYTSANDLPKVFAGVVEGAGLERPNVTMVASGGQTLAGHCNDLALLKMLDRKYDVVVLQEQSQIPALAENDAVLSKTFLDSCKWLSTAIRQRHPDTRIILFQTWAKDSSAWWQKPEPINLGRNAEEMQERISHLYAEAGKLCNAKVAHVGDVWMANYHAKVTFALHAEDGSHPSPAGTYLTALILANTVYNTVIVTKYNGEITGTGARKLQELAQMALGTP